MQRLSDATRDALSGLHPIIVANRGPVAWQAPDSAHPEIGSIVENEGGGVVVAMRAVAQATNAHWIATASTPADGVMAGLAARGSIGPDAASQFNMVFAQPTPAQYNDFYNVIANPLLWFIQHYLWDVPHEPNLGDDTERAWRDGYTAVNRQVADLAISTAAGDKRPPLVMFQDYHYYLAPKMVRAAIPNAVIQHFIHIPWPDPGYWEILPRSMRQGIVDGLLGNDIVGFQTNRDVRNFLRSCEETMGYRVVDGKVIHPGGVTAVNAYPISLDLDAFAKFASDPMTQQHLAALQVGRPEKLIVRVDRMDLSKNIVRGFIAYERMLEAHPEIRGHVQFYSFLQRTRTDVAQYQGYMQRIEREVARINGRAELRGPNGELPIRFEVGQDIRKATAAYMDYDVLVVNAVRDGMNLIAKEGPLVNRRNGVLVLSEGVGAHEELGEFALSVNPFNVDETARAMFAGLTMPPLERQRRVTEMQRVVTTNHLGTWIDKQAADINLAAKVRGHRRPGPDISL